jgi:hypothetical protein
MKDYGSLFTHKHHITPKFMGGDNNVDNLIEIGVEDHFKAHLILAENCENPYHKIGNKLAAAYLTNRYTNLTISNEEVGKLISEGLKELYKTKPIWNKGLTDMYRHTDESRKRISEALKGKYVGEKNGMYGKKHSKEVIELLRKYSKENNPMMVPEYVEKVRASKIGKRRPDMIGELNVVNREGVIDKIKNSLHEFHNTEDGEAYRARISKLTKENHPLKSEHSRKKLATSLKNRYNNLSEDEKTNIINTFNKKVTCEVCGKTTNIGNFTRWHKNKNCKLKNYE